MLKHKLKIILGMIIGVIIVSSISVYATYNYFAKDISYRKADGTELNVEQALNELYKNKGNLVTQIIDTMEYDYINYGEKEINVTNIEGWQSFKTENFFIRVNNYYVYGAASQGASGDTGITEIGIKSYENGILTINLPRHTRGNHSVKMNLDIVVTYIN